MLTNRLGLPQPFVDAATSDYTPTEGRYSVTRVIGSPCEAVLLRRHGGEVDSDVSDYVWAILGTAVHKILENSQETDSQLKESFLEVPVGKFNGREYTLSGIFDLYDDNTGTVTDYKTASVIKWQKGEFDDYRMQLLLYCWMLRKIGFDAHDGEIVMILRDWSNGKARFDKGYPQSQVQKVEFSFNQQHLNEAESYVRDWFGRVAEFEELDDGELEPCTPEQRWHRDDKWAVMRKSQKKAVKLFDSREEAVKHMDWLSNQASNKGRPLYIEERRGDDVKCEMYCSVRDWCPLWAKKIGGDAE